MIPIAAPDIGAEEREALAEILESGLLADGETVRAFEQEFSDYCGTSHGIATSNGTTALHTAFEALDIGTGDRVLTTPFSFVASANAIRLAGAEPVFADIDPETYNLDPDSAREVAETAPIDAILVVHLYGLPARMEPFLELADELDVPLVEDAAQAHGATYNDQRVGSFGDVGCFSFYPTKNMTTGEGGMIVTDREDVKERARRFINHGRTDTYAHASVGHNFRMTNIAAAIGRVQLERLPDFIKVRRRNASRLSRGLIDTPIDTPTEPTASRHVYHQYTVRTSDRDSLWEFLEARGIGVGVYYPECIHSQPAYSDIDHRAPIAERAADEVLSLPVHPNVSHSDIDRIVEVIHEYE